MAKKPRPRNQAKQETRGALIAAALSEFAEHGLDAPSLDAICARAGYTRGAFYVHFRDRTDLMVAVVEHAMSAFLDVVIASGDEAHDLERTVARFADAVALTIDEPRSLPPAVPLLPGVPFARILDATTRNPRLRKGFAALIARAMARLEEIAARGQKARAVRADVDPKELGFLLTTIALGTLVVVDTGLAIDPAGSRRAVLALLAPRRRKGGRRG